MSDRDSWTDPLNEPSPPEQKKRMSGCLLASLIVGGFGLVGMITCCGVAFWLFSILIPTETKIQAEVTAIGLQILNIDLMEGFSPDKAATADNFFYTARIAQFKHNEGKGEILISTVKFKYSDPQTSAVQARQLRKSFEDLVSGSLVIKKSESRDVTIDGQQVSVSFGEGADPLNGKKAHLVSAEFDKPAGLTHVLVRVDDEIWDEDAVVKMLENAKSP